MTSTQTPARPDITGPSDSTPRSDSSIPLQATAEPQVRRPRARPGDEAYLRSELAQAAIDIAAGR